MNSWDIIQRLTQDLPKFGRHNFSTAQWKYCIFRSIKVLIKVKFYFHNFYKRTLTGWVFDFYIYFNRRFLKPKESLYFLKWYRLLKIFEVLILFTDSMFLLRCQVENFLRIIPGFFILNFKVNCFIFIPSIMKHSTWLTSNFFYF